MIIYPPEFQEAAATADRISTFTSDTTTVSYSALSRYTRDDSVIVVFEHANGLIRAVDRADLPPVIAYFTNLREVLNFAEWADRQPEGFELHAAENDRRMKAALATNPYRGSEPFRRKP